MHHGAPLRACRAPGVRPRIDGMGEFARGDALEHDKLHGSSPSDDRGGDRSDDHRQFRATPRGVAAESDDACGPRMR
jgi:hypothetical protein